MIQNKVIHTIQQKEAIKQAIENKGVAVGNAPLSQYNDLISKINGYSLNIDGDVYTLMSANGEIFITIFDSNGYSPSVPITFKCDSKLKTIKTKVFNGVIFSEDSDLDFLMDPEVKYESKCALYCDFPSTLNFSYNVMTNNAFEQCRFNNIIINEEDLKSTELSNFKCYPRSLEYEVPSFINRVDMQCFRGTKNKKLTFGAGSDTGLLVGYFAFGQGDLSELNFLDGGSYKTITAKYNKPFYLCDVDKITMGSVGHAVTEISTDFFITLEDYEVEDGEEEPLRNVIIYVSNPSEGLPGAPWGGNLNITYMQA